MDIVGPQVIGKRFLFTLIDQQTSWPEAFPVGETNAEILTRIFEKEFLCRYGAPKILITDLSRQFIFNYFKTFCPGV